MAVFTVGSGNYTFSSPGVKEFLQKPIPQSLVISPGDTLAMKGDSFLVDITADYPDAVIYYCLDGQEPNKTSNVFYQPFYLKENGILKSKTFPENSPPSFVSTSAIDFLDPKINGLSYKYFVGKWIQLPEFD